MSKPSHDIHPEFSRQLGRDQKECLLQQRGTVVWLFGLSGSGKSTIANALEKRLHSEGRLVSLLDGDNLRSGINSSLGFSDRDREENIRRTIEIAKLFLNNGLVVIVSLITPRKQFRNLARQILAQDYFECFVKASYEACQHRDVKGLYAKQQAGSIKQFSGKTSVFEPPDSTDLVLDTEALSVQACVEELHRHVAPRIHLDKTS